MSAWKDEFDRRCRRLLGIRDDTLPVRIELDYQWYSEETGGYGAVTVYCGQQNREWTDMGALIRNLDEVQP